MTTSGSSSSDLVAKQKSRELPSWGWVLCRASRASPPPARPFSDKAPSRRSHAVPGPCGSASRGVLAPADTTTPGAPSPPRAPLRSCVWGEDRQTLAGAVLRVLAPLDGFSWLAAPCGLSTYEVFWTSPFAVAPDASRPSFMPLASLELPFRAFPSRGAVPALAGLVLPCGFAVRLSPAQRLRELRVRFPRFAPALRRSRPPEGGPGTHEPGRRFLASASPVASTHLSVCRTYRPHPRDTGLAGERPARPLRSFAPPGSPFRDDLFAWPG